MIRLRRSARACTVWCVALTSATFVWCEHRERIHTRRTRTHKVHFEAPRTLATSANTRENQHKAAFAARFDHTLLRADADAEDITRLCQEAHAMGFGAVCVNSSFVPLAVKTLEGLGSSVKVCAVVGFPLGAMSTTAKAFEASECVRYGAHEVDMVMHLGHLRAGNYSYVAVDIAEVVRVCREAGVVCKVILETGALCEDEKGLAASIALACGADFVKTSTGFGPGGATVEDVELLAQRAHRCGGLVKASGGIKDGLTALAMVAAGADRLGTSKSVEVCKEAFDIMDRGEEALFRKKNTSSDTY